MNKSNKSLRKVEEKTLLKKIQIPLAPKIISHNEMKYYCDNICDDKDKIYINPKNINDTKKGIAFLCSASIEDIKAFTNEYNKKVLSGIDKYLDRRLRKRSDQATMFLPITFKTLFKNRRKRTNWDYIPKQSRIYQHMIQDIMLNLIDIYHKTIQQNKNAKERIIQSFESNCLKIDKNINPVMYFAPTYDFLGVSWKKKNKFNDIHKIIDLDHEYVYPYTYFIPDWNHNTNAYDSGFLPDILEYLLNNMDKAIILQVLVPDGSWTESKRKKFTLYSDISFGLTTKGSIQDGESDIEACIRETYEESGGAIDLRGNENQLQYINDWGNLKLYII
jgi:hypothetical protein